MLLPLHVPIPTLERASVEQPVAPQVSPWWVWQPAPVARHKALLPQAASVHAVAQQMVDVPSLTQLPVPQSAAAAHDWPFFFKQRFPKQP